MAPFPLWLSRLARAHAPEVLLPALVEARTGWSLGADSTLVRALAARAKEVSAELLVGTFERGLARETRVSSGAFYTPTKVADALAHATLTRAPADATVLDPACGAGALLLAAFRWMRARGVAPDEALARLHGVDRDPRAVEACRLVLRLAAFEAGLAAPPAVSLTCADALFSEAIPRCDAVLANPPFASFSGRERLPLEDADHARLGARFRTFARWPTLHGPFVERALELSKQVVGLVLPEQVASLEGYRALREHVVAHATVAELKSWGEEPFDNTPVLTCVLDKSPGVRGLAWVPRSRLVDRIERSSEPLGPLVGDPGVHTGNAAARLLVPLGTPGSEPVLEGRLVRAFACEPPRRALLVDAKPLENEYFRIRPGEVYERATFLVRQTANRPIVGPRRHARWFRNSLLALASPADGRDVRFLVGVLNSDFAARLFRELHADARQATFPQVKVRALRQFPVPRLDLADPADRARHNRVVAVVCDLLDSPDDPQLRATLERAVLDAWRLSAAGLPAEVGENRHSE